MFVRFSIRFDDILINTGDFSVSYRDFCSCSFWNHKMCHTSGVYFLFIFYFVVCMEKSRHWEQSCKVFLIPNQSIKLNDTTSWVPVICGTC